MKFFISLLCICIIAVAVYWYSLKDANRNKKLKKVLQRAVVITSAVVVFLLGFLAFLIYTSATAPDIQCSTSHMTTSQPSIRLVTYMDYFIQGDYDYDTGNCVKALADYSASIKLNPDYPQAYNNRAYTLMRLHNYAAALLDLQKALALNPNYIQALMNRGDIHNYYFQIDRSSAISDYEKVISLGGGHGTSICGHLFMAVHNGWNLRTILDLPRVVISNCN